MFSVKWYHVFICVYVSFLSISRGQKPTGRPSVNTTNGEVIGWYIQSKASSTIYMRVFKGIPYAKPPVKELRFKDPSPAEAWTEAKNLSQSDPLACPQPQMPGRPHVDFSEDCLYIDVFTPQTVNSTSLLPVMVYIYGGAFTIGSSSSAALGPDYLVSQDIIYACMNYRLGAFGFLNLESDAVPGNAGLKDQLLALQWVQREISNFGGDPSKVTLFGESAGSVSVILHYLSPRSANVFSYAIAESGNPIFGFGFIASSNIDTAKTLSVRLNCSLVNDTVQLSCLQNAKVDDIIAEQTITSNFSENPSFGPCLEKPSADAFLSDTPMTLLNRMSASNGTIRPLITGMVRDEGVLEVTTMDPNFYREFYSQLQYYFIPDVRRSTLSEAEIESEVASIKSVYFNNTAPSLTNLGGYIKIYTDYLFSFSIAYFTRKLIKSNNVYLYQFDYNGGFKVYNSVTKALNITNVVGHADELGYIFYCYFLHQTTAPENSTDKQTLHKMVKMWTNFAKTGNPTPEGPTNNALGNFKWTPIRDGNYHYMRVTDQLNMSTDNFKEKELIFWSKIDGLSFGAKISSSFALISVVFVTSMVF